ncbi:MAG: hypothetical protein JXR68_04235 [Bacteroidales bacterium]|nr:hypothetical protein [Bacteroidales bacterium]
MMNIKIKPNTLNFENLKYYLVNEFPNVRFWELPKNKLLAEKNKIVGCYLIPSKKKIRVIGGFTNIRTNVVAIIITVLGGFILPIAIYYLLFYKHHNNFEKIIGETIAKKYSKYHLINKTAD